MTGATFSLAVTTQGPLYPPSEILDKDGNFIVVGRIPKADGTVPWGGAIVDGATVAPNFGEQGIYKVLSWIDQERLGALASEVLFTLPLPIPANNYKMLFAPEQRPGANLESRPSFPLHEAPIPDFRVADGRRDIAPITLGDWMRARGDLEITIDEDGTSALFEFSFSSLVPNSLYTVMSLRQLDLNPGGASRPGPLGIPNVFITDAHGDATFWARLPDPFPEPGTAGANRVINVIVLYMSAQMSHGGAIGLYGLGGDIHAHLKLKEMAFSELRTKSA